MEIAAVITAAGSSQRFGGVKKEYRALPYPPADGTSGVSDTSDSDTSVLTVLGAAALAFSESQRVGVIAITVPPDAENGEYAARKAIPSRLLARKGLFFVPGGSSRRISVRNALSALADFKPDYVLIHDGARPWVSRALIERVIDAVILYDAVLPALPVSETPKELDGRGFVRRHLARPLVALAQTPQAFAFGKILAAHEKAAERELCGKQGTPAVEYTDDAEIWGEFVGPVAVVAGDAANRKITFPQDLRA
jgi:2-C-methyl-D-erythritol 4-phosphate cytidylyltransferase/2-C-methyl-D-erythritol 4-phosphate cytidylyltransferase/2-C-methyl-D-erythritol 2,4-cyclodiphosphate synthase